MGRRTLNQSDKEEIGLKCCNCGSEEDLQYHHIIPLSLGGIDINSNICCLCYHCHYKLHHIKDSKINNFGELVKQGQTKAKLEGRLIGQKGNIITIVMNNGNTYKGTVKELSKIFNKNVRTIQLWCKNGINKRTKDKLNILDIYYSEIRHPSTKS